MTIGEELWSLSRRTVSEQLDSRQHAVGTALKSAAQDAKGKMPRTLATSVGALVPFPGVGTVLNAAISLALLKHQREMAKAQQKAAAQRRAADPKDFELIKKAAEADLRHAVDLLALLVTNQDKLTERAKEAGQRAREFEGVARGGPSYEKVWQAGMNVACPLHFQRHYEEKCLGMIEVLRLRLGVAEDYVKACGSMRRDVKRALVENVDLILEPAPGLVGMGTAQDSPPVPVKQNLLGGWRSDDFE